MLSQGSGFAERVASVRVSIGNLGLHRENQRHSKFRPGLEVGHQRTLTQSPACRKHSSAPAWMPCERSHAGNLIKARPEVLVVETHVKRENGAGKQMTAASGVYCFLTGRGREIKRLGAPCPRCEYFGETACELGKS